MKINKSKKGVLALSQIMILLIGILAISHGVGVVDGQTSLTIPTNTADWTKFKFLGDPKFDLSYKNQGIDRQSVYSLDRTGSSSIDGGTTKILDKKDPKSPLSGIIDNAKWALFAGAATFLLVAAINGFSGDEAFRTAFETGKAVGAGVFTGKAAAAAAKQYLGAGTYAAPIIGWAVGIAVAWNMFSKWLSLKTDFRSVEFQCKYWQPERGGENCGLCNNQELPCVEYQCKSLGGACDLINKDTDEPVCIWNDSRNIQPPEINPWTDALLKDYSYEPLPAVRGVEIKYKDQRCLPPFQQFSFGIVLDQHGYCKMQDHRTPNFEEMEFDFGGANWAILNQDQWMTFPSAADLEAEGIVIHNDGNYEYYVRCESPQGQASGEFLFKFCIEEGPDFSDPVIRRFDPGDQTPIRFFEEDELHEVQIDLQVSKPASCRWDHNDLEYENMNNTLSCSTSIVNFNAEFNYPCGGVLTGLENGKDNKFYFRCNSSAFGLVNKQSQELTLIGTRPLVITSVSPNDTLIRGSSDLIKVTLEAETSAGHENGLASCAYSDTGNFDDYDVFQNTGAPTHSTDIWLDEGDQNFFIQCKDLAGNIETKQISFSVEKDTSLPAIVRAYRDLNNLRIVTNEEAICVYSTRTCDYRFEDGINMTTFDNLGHSAPWSSEDTYHIRCEDEFGNRPPFGTCSMIIHPFNL